MLIILGLNVPQPETLEKEAATSLKEVADELNNELEKVVVSLEARGIFPSQSDIEKIRRKCLEMLQ